MDSAGADLQAQVPPAVRELFVDRVYSVDTPRWRVMAGTKTPSLLTLRVQQAVSDKVRWVAGRPPTGRLQPVVPGDAAPIPAGAALAYEVGLSREMAAAMGVELGDVLPLGLDSTDPLARGHNDKAAASVVGIYEVVDPADPYWSEDTTLQLPTQRALSADNVFVNAIGLLAPESYPELMSATDDGGLPLRYSWRYHVDSSRLAAGRVDDLLVDLRRLESVFPVAAVSVGAVNGTILRTGLLRFVEDQQARWRSAQAVLTAVAIGPATVAGAALGLIVLLGSGRRRSALGLARSRGASPGQIVGATVAEGLVLTVPAAFVALVLALVLIPSELDPPSVVIPVVVAALTVVLLVAAILPTARGATTAGRERGAEGRRAGPRRFVIDILVIGLAIGGAILLRDRGVRGASSTSDLSAADPFIAAVPALAGLAAAIVAVRLFSIPLRGFAAVAGLRRDLVPVLGMRRTARSGSATPILLVLFATASVGAFSLAALAHLDRAAEAVGWQEVGAPFRLVEDAGRLPHDFDPRELPGVVAVAGAHEARLTDAGSGGVDLLAVDLADYREVVAGSGAERDLPGSLLVADGEAVPAIVSPSGVVDGIRPGDRFQLTVAGKPTTFEAAAVEDAFPTLPVGGPFVVVDRLALAAHRPDAKFRTSTAFLRAPDEALGDIRRAMAVEVVGTSVAARTEVSAAIRTAPVVIAVTIGLLAAFAVAIAYAALALIAALALTGAARASESAHLRTLGLGRRQSIWLTIVEHGPTVVLAVILGIAFGLGIFVALRPGIGLGAIVGSTLDIPLSVGPGQLGPLIVALVAIVSLTLGLGAIAQREPTTSSALRRGIE